MSFSIHSQTAAACPTLGLQEKSPQDRRHHHRSEISKHQPAGSTDTGDWAGSVQISSAIRRAQDCQAVLGDALIFLQTQDEALARLQTLLQAEPPVKSEILEAITAECFNGIDLFGPGNHADTIRFEDLETQDAAEIERPAKPTATSFGNIETLGMRLAEAREKNHREQLHIEQMMEYDRQHAISEDFHLGHLSTPVEASQAMAFSRQTLLQDGSTALELQANTSRASVLRLFH